MLSDRHNIVVIADEAHRTQYGFEAKLKSRNTYFKKNKALALTAQAYTAINNIATGNMEATPHRVEFAPAGGLLSGYAALTRAASGTHHTPATTGLDPQGVSPPHDEGQSSHYQAGYAQHLRDALPNATFVAFTGTPVSSTDHDTRAVFGDYIHVYDMQQAKDDGATVAIYYESRLVKLSLNAADLALMDEARAVREEVASMQGVKVILTKKEVSSRKRTNEARELAIRQIINSAVVSERVVDIFDAVGLEKPNIGLLDDEFLAQVKNLPEKNLAVELVLQQAQVMGESWGSQ